MKSSQFSKNFLGFSLMEMVVSLGIMSILISTITPMTASLFNVLDTRETESELSEIELALETYYQDMGSFPLSDDDRNLKSLLSNFAGEDLPKYRGKLAGGTAIDPTAGVWQGPYILKPETDVYQDAWNRDYVYELRLSWNGYKSVAKEIFADVFGGENWQKRGYLFAPDMTQHVTIRSAGPNGIYNDEDDLVQEVSSRSIAQILQQDTISRITVLMNKLEDTRAVVPDIYAQLDNAVAGKQTGTGNESCPLSAADSDNEILTLSANLTGGLSEYYQRDRWGNYFRWHDETQQFYSLGPNRIDESCAQARIQFGDYLGRSMQRELADCIAGVSSPCL